MTESSGVFRVTLALLGLAVFAALFAGMSQGKDHATHARAFQLAPGDVRSDQVQPGSGGGNITVQLEVLDGPIDVFVVESALATDLAQGALRLDRPFSFRAEWSRLNVSGNVTIVLPADTSYDIILDNSDAYYDGDAQPTGVARVDLATRYPVEERGSILLGVAATVPSVLLVTMTLVRAIRRHRRNRRAAD